MPCLPSLLCFCPPILLYIHLLVYFSGPPPHPLNSIYLHPPPVILPSSSSSTRHNIASPLISQREREVGPEWAGLEEFVFQQRRGEAPHNIPGTGPAVELRRASSIVYFREKKQHLCCENVSRS